MSLPRAAAVLGVVMLSWVTVPASLDAQEGCEAIAPGNDLTRSLTVGGMRITYITNPHFLCAGGVEIWADSAEAFPDRGYSHLIGDVRYVEGQRELRADDARYFTNEGRLQAEGNLTIVDDEQGSSIENGNLVYLLQTNFRDVAEMTVVTGADGVRPVAILSPPRPVQDSTDTVPDSTSALERVTSGQPPTPEIAVQEPADPDEETGSPPEPKPYRVVGDRIFLLGNGYFTASGEVEIEQDSLLAYADSAEYDAEGTGLLLDGDARVVSDQYDLAGRRITMSAPGAPSRRIHARRAARLEGDGLLLTSAQIFLFLENDQLDRLVATPIVGPAAINADSLDHERPEANVQDFVLTADSLEVTAPNQTVERVFASGSARSVSSAGDSLTVELLPEVARTDWLEGDTVIVNFAEVGPAPSTLGGTREDRRLEVDDIIAIGRARSLYRLASSDSLARPGIDPPAVHYVVGSEIRIQMENRQVQGMQVAGQTQGVHLEPLQRRPQADTTQVDTSLVTDSLAIVDTVRAAVDTLDPAVIATRPDYPTTPRELGTAGRVRLSRPSPPLPSPDAPTRARTETQPWNRPWIR